MNNLTYFRPDALFSQSEKSRKSSSETKRESRILSIKEKLEDGFSISQKYITEAPIELSAIPKLKAEYNFLSYQNSQKLETLNKLKTEISLVKSYRKGNDNKQSYTPDSRASLHHYQQSLATGFKLSIDEQEELISKLNSELQNIYSKIEEENHITEQLEYMKTNGKQVYIKIHNKVDDIREVFSHLKRYEKDVIDSHVQADNQWIFAAHEVQSCKNETGKERSVRNEKLTNLKKKEVKLKHSVSSLTQRVSEKFANVEEVMENKNNYDSEMTAALKEYVNLKDMNENFKNQLRFYNEEFNKIKDIVKQSDCLNADPQIVDSYTPQEIAGALTRMVNIESQLQRRFEDLTKVHINLRDKCDEITMQLKQIKAEIQDSNSMGKIKEKAISLTKREGITTNELLTSIDLIGEDTARSELIEDYEKFEVYAVKFIVTAFSQIWDKMEYIAVKCPQDEVMSIYLARSKKTYKELQEDMAPRSSLSNKRSSTHIHRSNTRRMNTSKSPAASPISKVRIEFGTETPHNPQKTYTKQDIIDAFIQKFQATQEKAENFANEILRSYIFQYFIEKSDIKAIIENFSGDPEIYYEELLNILYPEASNNLRGKFAASLDSLSSALSVVLKVTKEIKAEYDKVDIETLQKKKAIHAVLSLAKIKTGNQGNFTSIDQLLKNVIQFKLKEHSRKKNNRLELQEESENFLKKLRTKADKSPEAKSDSETGSSTAEQPTRRETPVDDTALLSTRSKKQISKHTKNASSMPNLPKIDEKTEAYRNFKDLEMKIKKIKRMGRSAASELASSKKATSRTPSISIDN